MMEFLEMIWNFLNTNKEALATLIGVIEGIVVLINMWKKFRASGGVSTSATPPSFLKQCLWVVNPINVFKKA